jgi:hypothetical protein
MRYITLLILICLLSCKTKEVTNSFLDSDNTLVTENRLPNDSVNNQIKFDSIISFDVDDYPVTNEMLYDSTHNAYKRQVGGVFSLDKAWFTDYSLNQTLVFELYTDYWRIITFHFRNDDIPKEIIRDIGLSVSKSRLNNVYDTVSYIQKIEAIKGFIKSSQRIDKSYFITKKGFQIGDHVEKAIKIYGKPDRITMEQGIENYQWSFIGDYLLLEGLVDPDTLKQNDRLVAKNSFGHNINMFFRDKNLIGMIIYNEIP